MKRILFFLLFAPYAFLYSQSEEDSTIVGFYPTADSISEFPDLTQQLTIICQKKIEGRYVTFIGRKNEKKIFIAAVTLKPIKNVNGEISRTVNFDGPRPNPGKITTWGYVFDRNNDGKIDYMALVGGAGAFEDAKMPADYPRHKERLTMKQLEYFVGHCKIIFNHYADDNYDGIIDAAVIADADPERDFIKQRIVVRSTKFDGKFDETFAFQGKLLPETEHMRVDHSPMSVTYHPLGKPTSQITQATLDEKTSILKLLNQAAAECKVEKDISQPEE